ncbi:MAG: hypothetical protein M3245_05075 [Actinomycetota bacterium]|nr:hypothetical protein [Actinomycetota bacterium]
MDDTHTHGSQAHAHEGGTAMHDHDTGVHDDPVVHRDEAPRTVVPAAVETGVPAGGAIVRIVLTVAGAAAMIVGAFVNWLRGEAGGAGVTRGVDIEYSVFWSTEPGFQQGLVTSAGLVVIALAVLALVGLAFRSGWLTRLAGALGIVAMALFAITLYRVPDANLSIGHIGPGAWLVVAGALVVVVAGFLGSRPRIVATATPVDV